MSFSSLSLSVCLSVCQSILVFYEIISRKSIFDRLPYVVYGKTHTPLARKGRHSPNGHVSGLLYRVERRFPSWPIPDLSELSNFIDFILLFSTPTTPPLPSFYRYHAVPYRPVHGAPGVVTATPMPAIPRKGPFAIPKKKGRGGDRAARAAPSARLYAEGGRRPHLGGVRHTPRAGVAEGQPSLCTAPRRLSRFARFA